MAEMLLGAFIMFFGTVFGWALARTKFKIDDED